VFKQLDRRSRVQIALDPPGPGHQCALAVGGRHHAQPQKRRQRASATHESWRGHLQACRARRWGRPPGRLGPCHSWLHQAAGAIVSGNAGGQGAERWWASSGGRGKLTVATQGSRCWAQLHDRQRHRRQIALHQDSNVPEGEPGTRPGRGVRAGCDDIAHDGSQQPARGGESVSQKGRLCTER